MRPYTAKERGECARVVAEWAVPIYGLGPSATLMWFADPGGWTLRIFHMGNPQLDVTFGGDPTMHPLDAARMLLGK